MEIALEKFELDAECIKQYELESGQCLLFAVLFGQQLEAITGKPYRITVLVRSEYDIYDGEYDKDGENYQQSP